MEEKKDDYEERDGFYVTAGYIRSTIDDMSNYIRYYLDENSCGCFEKMTDDKIIVMSNMFYGLGLFVRYHEQLKFQNILVKLHFFFESYV